MCNPHILPTNALDIITKAQSITEDEAKLRVKANIARHEHQERYCKLRDDYTFAP
jgi:hypothetical protein